MKLPWVSRELYERALQEAKDWSAIARDATNRDDDSDRRFDRLFDKYHALKLQGATIPEPVVLREKKEPDALTQAVLNACAGKPPQVRAMMMKQLNADRNNPLLEEIDILRRIENGFTADDGIPGE